MFEGEKKMTASASEEKQPPTHYLSPERSSPAEISARSRALGEYSLLSAVLETFPGGTVVLDENRQIIAANKIFLNYLGLQVKEEVLGKRPGELVGCRVPPTAPGGCGTGKECRHCGLVNTVVDAITSGETATGECRIALASGNALDMSVAATAAMVADSPVVFVGLEDIGGRKRREVLEKTFFHDLMNTAGGMRGSLGLLEEELAGIGDADLVSMIVRLAQNLVEEIQAFRQLSAAERQDLAVEMKLVDIRALLKELVTLYANHQVAEGKTLLVSNPDDLRAHTDPRILHRVLGNLIKNALEATAVGGTVRVEATQDGRQTTFHVSNPGVMPPEVKLQMFQRSFSTKGEGRGIGTYSVKLLGEHYLGGRVSFTSEEGQGTCFTLEIPNSRDATSGVPDEKPPGKGSASDKETEAPVPGLRVLMADDSKTFQLLTQRLLTKMGLTIETVGDGEQALEKLQTEDFDLVLMDVNMPGMGGVSATKLIRQLEGRKRTIPVIGLTGGISDSEVQTCLDAGMNDVIGKPFDKEALTSMILTLARRHAHRDS